jgi:hypothetical protein
MSQKSKDKENKDLQDISADYTLDNWMPSTGLETMGLDVMSTGHGTVDSLDPSFNVTYGDIGTIGTPDMFEEELKKKYPALQDAWEHYQNVKQLCETREKEEDDS